MGRGCSSDEQRCELMIFAVSSMTCPEHYLSHGMTLPSLAKFYFLSQGSEQS